MNCTPKLFYRSCISSLIVLMSIGCTLPAAASVKRVGSPQVINYDNTVLQAGTQTWMIEIGANGLAYFANNDGVLEFDGTQWRTYPLPEKSVVRSIKATADGRIYAGGYNELGYFEPDPAGRLVFHPLKHMLPDSKLDFGDVWKIYQMGSAIIFQSYEQIMLFDQESLVVIEAPDMFHFSYLVHNKLYINDQTEGLFMLHGQQLLRLEGTEKLIGKLIWGMLPLGKEMLIATANEGIFLYDGELLRPWETQLAELLADQQVFCAMPVDEQLFAFGTIQDGLFISDAKGNLMQHINIDKGLQNNTVLSLQIDQFNNMWLGLDNGIDYVKLNSPISYFSAYNNISSGYAAVVHDGLLYLGSNRGVFYMEWDRFLEGGLDQKFTLVSGTRGQVWSLEVIDGSLFCGHNSGVFIIEGNRSNLISNVQGGWTFLQPDGRDDIVIAGTYTHLVRFEKSGGRWTEGRIIEGFKESSRYMVNDGPRSIWISHGYKGVFHLSFDENYERVEKVGFYNSAHGFPSDKDISVFQLSNQAVFTTGQGLYTYHAGMNTFVPNERLTSLLGRDDMIMLREDNTGNVWYFAPDDAGVFRKQEDGNYNEVDIPFKPLQGRFIKWFQFVYPHDEDNVFIATQNGFAHYRSTYAKNYQKPFKAYIRCMRVLSGVDSMLYKGSSPANEFFADIPFRFNNIQFEFSANHFENPERIKYHVQLQGFDKEWVEWRSQTTRQYTNLAHGDYTFKVKAVNVYGTQSEMDSIRFTILPPWYLSRFAYVAYVLLAVGLIALLFVYVRYRIERSKQAFKEEQQQLFLEREKQLQIESLLAEQEVIKLRNEKLRLEKIQKDKELANTTMQIIQKSKSLVTIKKSLKSLSRDLGQHPAVNQVNLIIKKINRSIDTDKQWEVFESHFENVHEAFLKRLKEQYPDLTPRELKLCAYLRLNISSKEIANLMNISVRGVEISRYRLRKKLGLEHDQNLTDFILSFNDKE